MHGFGLVDLYDNDKDEDPLALGGVGKFGLMSKSARPTCVSNSPTFATGNIYGWTRNQRVPGHLNPFSRVLARWLDPIEITRDGFYAIQPAEISSQVFVIRKKFPAGEYLYLENRQPYRW